MPLKQLFLAVVAVGLFAMIAFYWMEMQKIGVHNETMPTLSVQEAPSSEGESPDEETEAAANTQVPTSDATPPASNPVATTDTTAEANSPSVEDDLSELDSLFEEDYDDSSVDGSFSGNLDEAI